MIVFCAFEQQMYLIEKAREHGINRYIPMQFYKNYSAQVLKANMRVVGNTEYALLLYRDKLPKFNNDGRMIFNCVPFQRDTETPKIHPTQKPVKLLEYLIGLFTEPDDVVIDPCACSCSTLRAAFEMGRNSYGFEVDKGFYKAAQEKMLATMEMPLFVEGVA